MKNLDVRFSVFFFSAFILCSNLTVYYSPLFCQSTEEEIKATVERVDKGEAEQVKTLLPDLITKYQNSAGILYLQGRLANDGLEAAKFYQGVVDNFPKSEWADDALYRIYQYYYSLGLYRTADLKLQQLKKDYPNSPYVAGKVEEKTPPQEEKPVQFPTKEIVVSDTQKNIQVIPPSVKEPYTLQVGAFSTIANAKKQKSFIEDLGYTVEITNKIRAGRNLFLVWVGSFKNTEDARILGKQLKAKYKIDSMIVERY